MVGRTLCERIGGFLDSLSPADKEQVERRASRYGDDPNLQLAIDSMIRVGTYYQGTNEVIAQAFSKHGLQGDKLQAEVDRTTLKAALRFYQTFDPALDQNHPKGYRERILSDKRPRNCFNRSKGNVLFSSID